MSKRKYNVIVHMGASDFKVTARNPGGNGSVTFDLNAPNAPRINAVSRAITEGLGMKADTKTPDAKRKERPHGKPRKQRHPATTRVPSEAPLRAAPDGDAPKKPRRRRRTPRAVPTGEAQP